VQSLLIGGLLFWWYLWYFCLCFRVVWGFVVVWLCCCLGWCERVCVFAVCLFDLSLVLVVMYGCCLIGGCFM